MQNFCGARARLLRVPRHKGRGIATFRQEIPPFYKNSHQERHFREWHHTCHALPTRPISEEVYTL